MKTGISAIAGLGLSVFCLLLCFLALGCCQQGAPASECRELLSPDNLDGWRMTRQYTGARPWVFENDAFRATAWPGNWVIYEQPFADFELVCEFLFEHAQGGIVLRGADEGRPWRSGYELDIDWADKPTHGHIHFPVLPKTPSGRARFEAGKWHIVKVRAVGKHFQVWLDGEEVFEFTDSTFRWGHIILEGEAAGVRYRNLRVRPIGPAKPTGARLR